MNIICTAKSLFLFVIESMDAPKWSQNANCYASATVIQRQYGG